jgi:type VI secretion system VgrG family protein
MHREYSSAIGSAYEKALSMNPDLIQQLSSALVEFSSATRLYAVTIGEAASDNLLVEAFVARETMQEVGARELIVLSTNAHVELEPLLGEVATLEISLADGTRTSFAGEITEIAMLGSDGGFARYRVRISPWIWRLAQVRNSRVWQDKGVIDIVNSVFDAYRPHANWRWSGDTMPFMDEAGRRSYCCQYRESDLDFVQRILAEEGLGWRFEQAGDRPCLVVFADSSQPDAVPEDASSAAGGYIRYHGERALERQDTVQSLIAQRRLHATLTTVLSCDYKAKRVVAASSPTRLKTAARLPALESFDVPGQYAYQGSAAAKRHADLQMQAKEARSRVWLGRSTVRTLRAGTKLTVTGAPLQQLGDAASFAVVAVTSVGVNNLPPAAQHALAELFGPIPELLEQVPTNEAPDDMALAITQAVNSGYANCFEAVPAELPWRPQLPGTDGRQRCKSTAMGAQTAIVVGPDGSDTPSGADEIYSDRLGRVRIRFHWQDDGGATCWVRVAQRSAGGGMGSQFLPRIGQEVVVQFLENDIDRPIVVGAVYNGRGEGGTAPTPGGAASADTDEQVFKFAHDHSPSGQGNLAGGNSPVWHGASADSTGHRNGAAQWGVRSKEFGGTGYNQLLFDDTDAQGRVQLKSTFATSELNLGHLIHAADNYRGSFRGLGAELRTDAYGAVRAGAGLLVSSYKVSHSAGARDPVGDNAAGAGLLAHASKLVASLHSAALTHKTVGLAAHAGVSTNNASALDAKLPPLTALVNAVSGTVEIPGSGESKLPYQTAAVIAVAAKDGLGAVAGQSVQLATGETVTLASGADAQFATGGQMRVHTGQAIGVLGGATNAGEGDLGLQLVAAKDAIDIRAHADGIKVQARDEVNVISANAHVDWAAAKRISLSTAGGANITIDGGNITVQCSGKITVRAGKKSFTGPERLNFTMPALPGSICIECLRKSLAAGAAFTLVE